ncbi:MAG TPA: HNH endonuclease [Streptomyces sp.]|nr:HNH endonuclease [Streptomyces sp.]
MDPERTLDALAARGVRFPHRGRAPCAARRHPLELPGGRRRAITTVRLGQDVFRKALIRQYGMICAVTGPAPAEVLEAAHLQPFATTEHHRVEEGLLLRADIHRLFDSDLLAISPDLVVRVAPSLMGHVTYSALEGSPLLIPTDCPLDLDVIKKRHAVATATW